MSNRLIFVLTNLATSRGLILTLARLWFLVMILASFSVAAALDARAANVVAGSDTSTISSADYGKPSQSRIWYNHHQHRWDALIPKNDGGSSASDHYIMKDVSGDQIFTSVELEDRNTGRPDTFWDEATNTLYVLGSHGTTTKIWKVDYDISGDSYSIDPNVDGVTVTGITHESRNHPAALHVSPNGYLWVGALSTIALEVQRSADDGETWLPSPINLDANVFGGVVAWSHFTHRGTSYVGLFAGENAGMADHTLFYYWYIDQDLDPSVPTNWTDDSFNIPSLPGTADADDHVASACDSSGNLYFVVKTQEGGPSDPLINLYKRTPAGVWSEYTVTETGEDPKQSRPSLVVDDHNSELHVFMNDADAGDGNRKRVSLGSLDDLAGAPLESVFSSDIHIFNNLVTPRHRITSAGEFLVLAHELVDLTVWWTDASVPCGTEGGPPCTTLPPTTTSSTTSTTTSTTTTTTVPGCGSDGECEDGNQCTKDVCIGGQCVSETVSCPQGMVCDPATGSCEQRARIGIDEESVASRCELQNTQTLRFNVTAGDRANRMLIVGAACEDQVWEYCDFMRAKARFGATELRQAVANMSDQNSYMGSAALWTLGDEGIAAECRGEYPCEREVTITMNAPRGEPDNLHGGAYVLHNVEQGPPEETAAAGDDPCNGGLDTAIVTKSDGSWVVDVGMTGESVSFETPGQGQVARWTNGGCVSSSSQSTTKHVRVAGPARMAIHPRGMNRCSHVLAVFAPSAVPVTTSTTTLPPTTTTSSTTLPPTTTTSSTTLPPTTTTSSTTSTTTSTTTTTTVPECRSDAECEDGDRCTKEACIEGQCVSEAVSCPQGMVCDPATGICEPWGRIGIDEGSVASRCEKRNKGTLKFEVTAGDHGDRMLVVGAACEDQLPKYCDFSGAKAQFGATELRQAVANMSDGTSYVGAAALWTLGDKGIAAECRGEYPCKREVRITMDAPRGQPDNLHGGAYVLHNVEQGPPEETAAAGGDPCNGGLDTAIVTMSDGSWVVDVGMTGKNMPFETPGEGQVARWTNGGCVSSNSQSTTKHVAVAGPTRMTINPRDVNRCSHVLAVFAPSAVAGTTELPPTTTTTLVLTTTTTSTTLPVPFCGDAAVNQTSEECDGADDSTCPDACQTDCRCEVSVPVGIIEADVSVLSIAPSRNFGASELLLADARTRKNTFLRVRVEGLGATVQYGAFLRMQVADVRLAGSGSGGRIHSIRDCGWDELATTWNTQPAIDGPVLAELGSVKRNTVVEFDLSAAITGDGTYCFALDSGSWDGVTYYAREASVGGPELIFRGEP